MREKFDPVQSEKPLHNQVPILLLSVHV